MRKFLIPLAVAAIATGAIAAAPADRAARAAADDAKFQQTVQGLVPGKPIDCIDTRFQQASLSAIGPRLIYRVSNRLVYVNDTNGGCESVRSGDALVTRQFSTQLCRGDIAQTVNMMNRIPTGSCAMGSFTPYRPG